MATVEELQAEIAHLKRDVAELKNRLIWGSRRGLGPQSIVSDLDITGDFGVAGQVAAASATYPVLTIERTTATTNLTRGTMLVQLTSSGDAVDGFGPGLYFGIEDDAASPQNIANINAERSGADNTGKMLLRIFNAGTEETALTLDTSQTTVAKNLVVGGFVAVKDGMTAPGATSGFAKIYVDSADGDLKVKFADGTTKTIVTDT